MNVLDWGLVILFAIGALWGYRTGLVDAVLNLIAVYVALTLSGQFAGRILSLIWDGVESEALSTAIGYVIIFVAVFLASRVLSRIVKSALRMVLMGWVDKLGGVVVGLAVGVLLSGGLLAVIARYTYVIPADPPAGNGASVTDQLREYAEGFLESGVRETLDGQMVNSAVAPAMLDIRGTFAGFTPDDFSRAMDILDSRIESQP